MPEIDNKSLSPVFFHILLSLGAWERHGYAIKREVAERTEGKLKLGPGVLYGAINALLENGLIAEAENRPEPHLDDERRRYYRITPQGRKAALVTHPGRTIASCICDRSSRGTRN